MASIAGVRFRRSGVVSYYDAQGLDVEVGDWVMVDRPEGPTLAWVVIAPSQVIFADVKETAGRILRKATAEDLAGPERIPGQGKRLLVIRKEEPPS